VGLDGWKKMTDLVVAQRGALDVTRFDLNRLVDTFLGAKKKTTQRAYLKDLKHFRSFIESTGAVVPTINAAMQFLFNCTRGKANLLLLDYQNALIAKELSPATINRRLAAVRSFVKLARTTGFIDWALDVTNVDAQAYRDTRGPGELKLVQMLDKADERNDSKGIRDRAILHLLTDLALRRSEVVSLGYEHINLIAGEIWLLGKGRSQRVRVELPDETKLALSAWIDVRGEDPGPLFVALDHGHYGHALSDSAVYNIVRGLGGAETVRPHGIRHTAITSALDKSGGNTREVQQFSRHKDGRVLHIYDDARQNLGGKVARLVADRRRG